MNQTYVEFVSAVINSTDIGYPIYTKHISKKLAINHKMAISKASAAVSNAMKRIIDSKIIPELRIYQNGIYYRCKETVFGETTINVEQLIIDKYLYNDNGYETGYYLLHKLGLTTQLANERIIVTNFSKDCTRKDKKLDVTIRPTKTLITSKNKYYLQILDVIDLLDTSPIDSDDPYELIGKHIDSYQLNYADLLALANRYYNKKTIFHLAEIATKGSKL